MQVSKRFRNYRHPTLMLDATSLVMYAADPACSREHVVKVGRSLSALAAAGAVALLAIAGFVLRGWLGWFAVATAVAPCLPLVVSAHYFKEDTYLVLGVACTALSVVIAVPGGTEAWVSAKGCRMLPWVIVGLSAGLAMSAKYFGVVALVFALLAVCAVVRPVRRLARSATAVAGAAAGVVVFLHMRAIADPQFREIMIRSLTNEATHGVSSHRGLKLESPALFFAGACVQIVHPLAWVGTCLLGLTLLRPAARSRVGLGVLALPLAALAFLIPLAWCPLPDARYALPTIVLITAAGGLGWASLPLMLPHGRAVRAAGWVAATACGLVFVPTIWRVGQRFRDDSRFRLAEWASTSLSATSVVAQDSKAGLARTTGRHGERFKGRVLGSMFVMDLGTIRELQALGVTHIVVASSTYGRYLDECLAPDPQRKPGSVALTDRRRSGYKDLFSRNLALVWSSHPPGHAPSRAERLVFTSTDPEICVFALPPSEQDAAAVAEIP